MNDLNVINPLCPCGSGKSYSDCCEPFHKGTSHAPTARDLMKSRYSAYAKGKVDYILLTTHPKHSDQLVPEKKRRLSIENFCKTTRFVKLEILDDQEKESQATVTFHAILMQNGQDASFTEKSLFEKLAGRWYYLKGVVSGKNS